MKTRRNLPGVVLLGLWASVASAQNWQQYQHDAGHSGHSEAAVDPAQLVPVWNAPGYTEGRILGDTLFAKKIQGVSTTVSAFSLADGTRKWTQQGQVIYFGNMAVGVSWRLRSHSIRAAATSTPKSTIAMKE